MKKRIAWIDVAKYIAMMFVMLSHLEACPSFLRSFFTPFYLAVFYFCSGYCYRHRDGFNHFIQKKAKQLLLPWFFYSNLNILISNFHAIKTHRLTLAGELYRNLLQIRYYDERLWFLPALFMAYIVFYFVIRSYMKHRDRKKTLTLCIALAFLRKLYKTFMDPSLLPWGLTNLPWHIDYIPTPLLFMVLGHFYRYGFEKKLEKYDDTVHRLFLWAIYLVLVYAVTIGESSYAFLLEFAVDHIRHIIAIALVVSFSKLVPDNKYVLFIGSNTLLCFCIHNKFATLMEAVFKKVFPVLYATILASPGLSAFYCVLMTLILSFILIVPIKLILRFVPWTIGQKPLRAKK